MARRSRNPQSSAATLDEALRIARGTQSPGQTKAQTRLIAKGIQKGIEQYRQRQNAKARELDKNLKKVKGRLGSPIAEEREAEVEEGKVGVGEKPVGRHCHLPWVLLVLSWLAMAAWWIGR